MISEEFIKRHQYDRLYRIASRLFEKYDICGVRNGTCIRGRALKRRGHKRNLYSTAPDGLSFCCGAHLALEDYNRRLPQACPCLVRNRCSAVALNCKLWMCDEAWNHANEFAAVKLQRLQRIAQRAGFLPNYRATRAEVFEHLFRKGQIQRA